MKMVLAIAAGGALGAVARHFAAAQFGQWLGQGFPWGILLVNILGSFLMGALVEAMTVAWSPSLELRALLVVGVLGAFTTFSTFGFETYALLADGDWWRAAANITVQNTLGLAAVFCGYRIAVLWQSV